MRALVIVCVLAGRAVAEPAPTIAALHAGFGEQATAEGFAKLVASPLPIAGLGFADPTCDRAFGHRRDVPRAELASLYSCLHAAHAEVDVLPNGVALYYGDPIELWMIASLEIAHGRVDRIAPYAASRADATLPTFAVSYRGFSPSARVIKAAPSRKPAQMSAELKLCLAADDTIASRHLVGSSGFSDFDADVSDYMASIDRDAIHTDLRPPLPSCAIVFVSYPDTPPLPPPPPPPPPPPQRM